VFKRGAIFRHAKRVFPFDTGGSQKGLYEPAVKATSALGAYELLPTVESARRLVKGFFDIDQGYLSNKPKGGMTFDPAEADVNSYYQLIHGSRATECDDRCSTIEVQLADDLDLRREILMAVVLPTHFLDDSLLRKTISVESAAVDLLRRPRDAPP
jgi:hypothetical protein